jgi:FkbM family methyltransferase
MTFRERGFLILKKNGVKDVLKAIISYVINGFLRPPAFAWKIRGYCTISVCAHDIKFGISVLEDASPYFELYENRREPEVISVLCNTLKGGDIFFDVGAYYGYYTLIGSKLIGQSGHVFAFEPDPVARLKLERNIKMNDAHNIDIVPLALSNSSGKKALTAPIFGKSISQISEMASDSLQSKVDVNSTILDEFVYKHNIMPTVIKIDVEGHEDKVFEGGQKVLSQNLTVLLEFHVKELIEKNVDPYAFYKKLFKLNKRVFFLTDKKAILASEDMPIKQWPSNYFIITP